MPLSDPWSLGPSSPSQYEWLITINENIEKATAEKEAAFTDATDDDAFAAVWQPDKTVSTCPLCNYNFNMLRRRHHVRHVLSILIEISLILLLSQRDIK